MNDKVLPDPRDLATRLEDGDVVLIDRRDRESFEASHIPGAVNAHDIFTYLATSSPYGTDYCPRKGRIPGTRWLEWCRMMKPGKDGPVFKSKDEIMDKCQTVGITPDTHVILYCFKGARTSNIFIALKEAGVKDVRTYFESWNDGSRDPALPIVEGFPILSRFEGSPARKVS